MKRLIFILVCMSPATLSAQNYVNSQLPWHEVVLDAQGKLLAWHHPGKNQGYDLLRRSVGARPAQALSERGDLSAPGYTIRALDGGDYVIRIRRLDSNEISIS